ncbi:MAG: iron-sulfur cluster biosynthesis family protein [Streptococcaceae bacterium]|jgi:uncharacterized protein YqkB|nr:iron-sulfur cluster biosynthesis family protein [Streptococcaceae bacterium]
MQLTTDAAVKEMVMSLQDRQHVLALDYDDSVGESGIPADACAIVGRIRLLVVEKSQLPESFDGTVESDLGPIYFKSFGARFLDETMNARKAAYSGYELMGSGGLLTPNLLIEKI